MKIVVNRCFGGYSLSKEAMDMLGATSAYDYEQCFLRADPKLVETVETLGKAANGRCADLQVVEIPDSATDWLVQEFDGMETVIFVFGEKIHFA